MLDLIVRAMGKPPEDPEVQELLAALGSKPDKPAKPNKDGYVVAKRHGVELLFSSDVTSDRFPVQRVNRKLVKYLCHCWLRPEKYAGPWPGPYRPDLTLDEMRRGYGEGFDLWGFEWDEVAELRWRVPLASRPGVELHPTFHLQKGRPSLIVALESHQDYFAYIDAARADPHAGFFVGWCAARGLLHPDLAARAKASVKKVKAGKMTGRELIVAEIDHRAWDNKHNHVWSCDLSPGHAEFFHCYLHGVHTKALWGKEKTGYYDDFRGLFGKRFRGLREHPPRWDEVPDDREHAGEMEALISARFEAWAPRSKERRRRVSG